MFSVCSSCKNCPSATCAAAAYVLCKDVDIFRNKTLVLDRILYVIIFITISRDSAVGLATSYGLEFESP
jgi:hypothetical protein